MKAPLAALLAVALAVAVAAFLVFRPTPLAEQVTIVWSGKPVFVRHLSPQEIESNARGGSEQGAAPHDAGAATPRASALDFAGGTVVHLTPFGTLTIALVALLVGYLVWRGLRRR